MKKRLSLLAILGGLLAIGVPDGGGVALAATPNEIGVIEKTLKSAAQEKIQQHGIKLSAEAATDLDAMISAAAAKLAGAPGGNVAEAQKNLERFLDALAVANHRGRDGRGGNPDPEANRDGKEKGGEASREVSKKAFQNIKARFCPLYPFC